MKLVGSFSKWMVCGVAAAAVLAVVVEAAVGKAVVRTIRGTAQYSEKGGELKSLRVGKVLGPSSTVKAGVNSTVDLFLADNGPVVRVTSDTTLDLGKLEIDRTGVEVVIETMLDLKSGIIQGNVKKLADASKYEVKTPYTVCAIRGTEYQISADGIHHVITGSVLVAYTNPRTGVVTTHPVNQGQTFIPPVDPANPAQVPQVLPSNNLPPGNPPPLPPIPPGPGDVGGVPADAPITVVPEPVEFVSPGTGTAGSGTAIGVR